MRRLSLISIVRLCCLFILMLLVLPKGHTQLGRQLQRAAQRGAERALERKAEEKAAEAVEKVFEQPESRQEDSNADRGLEDHEPQDPESQSENPRPGRQNEAARESSDATATPAQVFKYESKFDFVPGSSVIYYDDFARAEIGDFPTGYNTLGSAEIVNINSAPGKWMRVGEETGGLHFLELSNLPADFTLELDLIHDIPAEGYRYNANFGIMLSDETNPDDNLNETIRIGNKCISFWMERDIGKGWLGKMQKWSRGSDLVSGTNPRLDTHFNDASRGKPQRIAIWRQGKRMRLYVNQQKVYDLPLAWPDDQPIPSLRIIASISDPNDKYLFSNIRVAKGAPDTRSKLEKEGKLVTYGITFASGSSTLEPGSAGTLREIAQTLRDNPSMRVRITGHTDADGSEESNLKLSQDRASAVKNALSQFYSIDGSRMETAGKGESAPLNSEDTPAAKASNRRVEFEVLK